MRAYDFKLDTENTNPFKYARTETITRLFNSLSILFPVGERFFVESIRHYRPDTPELEEEIKLFILEEAKHSMQHKRLNDLIKANGYDIDKLEKNIKKKLSLLGDKPETKLIITTCLEIFTQYGADLLLIFEQLLLKDNSASELWRYHAREEAGHGHRTIAHKMLNKVHPTSTLKLTLYFIVCMVILAVQVGENYIELSKF